MSASSPSRRLPRRSRRSTATTGSSRRELGRRIRNQIKSIPELQFFLDDSLEYIEHIEQALRND